MSRKRSRSIVNFSTVSLASAANGPDTSLPIHMPMPRPNPHFVVPMIQQLPCFHFSPKAGTSNSYGTYDRKLESLSKADRYCMFFRLRGTAGAGASCQPCHCAAVCCTRHQGKAGIPCFAARGRSGRASWFPSALGGKRPWSCKLDSSTWSIKWVIVWRCLRRVLRG